jgi:hypothetical protein
MRQEMKKTIVLSALLLSSPMLLGQDDFDAEFDSLFNDNLVAPQEVSQRPADPAQDVELTPGDLENNAVDTPTDQQTMFGEDPNRPPVDPTSVETVTIPDQAGDELEALQTDIGTDDDDFTPAESMPAPSKTVDKTPAAPATTAPAEPAQDLATAQGPAVFDVGREERELLALAENIQGQISDSEWNEVATAAKAESYTVVKDDWLFKISKRLFGTGFYYPKIWSLNSFITNPHFIEPGMILSFTTGSASTAPEFKLGAFSEDELAAEPGTVAATSGSELSNFGEGVTPEWVDEKARLSEQGVYFQYASNETMEDLQAVGELALNREYEHYDPPKSDLIVKMPGNYDADGFDNKSRIYYSFKEGFYLSTFVSTNIVQDFGAIVNGPDENIFFTNLDKAYVKFDESINALAGDKFSVYSAHGRVSHPNSDRRGYKYSIVGQIRLLRKIRDKWEVEFFDVSGTPQRGDRITAFTPKIPRITKTYNSRMVEAGILATFQPMQSILGFGDVVYIDRGRADGVEMGNVFDVYGFKDRLTKKNITDQPTYKMGELTVITLTDNFATALVTKSRRDFYAGDLAISRTKEAHLREQGAQDSQKAPFKGTLGGKALEELDVELNLENLNEDLLKEADKIQLTEDELAELERQEREKSVIRDSERDLKSLERLESEIEQAERILNDAKLDEDKLLEQQNLNEIEKKHGAGDQESLDEIEENLGKRYIDEDLNSKDNPFGLTEFDVEEVDELLNIEKSEQ